MDRAFVLQHLRDNHPITAEQQGWIVSEASLRSLSESTCLLTYRLQQGIRITRRSTLWSRTESGWQILYHQGTVVTTEQQSG